MHYVTEDELREAYGACPFEKYELPEGARLTPSARQFLIDFRIEFEDDEQGPRPRGDKRGAHGRPHRKPAADLGAVASGRRRATRQTSSRTTGMPTKADLRRDQRPFRRSTRAYIRSSSRWHACMRR